MRAFFKAKGHEAVAAMQRHALKQHYMIDNNTITLERLLIWIAVVGVIRALTVTSMLFTGKM